MVIGKPHNGSGGLEDSQTREDAGSKIYAPLIELQLTEEANKKVSFEQRAMTVISTSGVLVSLLFGLAAVVTNPQTFVLPDDAKNFIIAALYCFVSAAIAGIICNWPLLYSQIEVSELNRLLEPRIWNGSSDIAARRIAEVQVKILARARQLNALKGRVLLVGMILEVGAVILLAFAVAAILMD